MREIRRRTRVVGAFPDGQSCLNLAAAPLRHIAGTQWSTRKYMNMAPLRAAETEVYGTGLSDLRSGNSARSGSCILAFPLDVGLGVRGPFFVDLDQDGGDEALEGVFAGKDADLDGAALELRLDGALPRV
jgi:hypothetical protein